VDVAGNAHVAAVLPIGDDDTESRVLKYDASGKLLWEARYGAGGPCDEPAAIALDADGNVVVTGSVCVSHGTNYITVKYDALGNELWTAAFDGIVGQNDDRDSDDQATALLVDAAGNVHVTGESYGLDGQDCDFITIKYAAGGSQLWVARHSASDRSDDHARALAADDAGNLLAAGWTREAGDESEDWRYGFAVVKYTPEGGEAWAVRVEAPAGARAFSPTLAVDATGAAHLAGYTFFPSGSETPGVPNYRSDPTALKLDASGRLLWLSRVPGPAAPPLPDLLPAAIALDGAGHACVAAAGGTGGGDPATNFLTLKLDSAGTVLWARESSPWPSMAAATCT
jgi:hypothetical protein